MDIKLLTTQATKKSQQALFNFANKLLFEGFFRNYFLLNASCNSIVWIFTLLIIKLASDSQIIIHYNINFGVDLIGSPARLYYFPVVGLSFFIINLIIAFNLEPKNRLFAHLLLIGSWLGNVIVLAGLYSLYIINFR